jgi:hypothetical protein
VQTVLNLIAEEGMLKKTLPRPEDIVDSGYLDEARKACLVKISEPFNTCSQANFSLRGSVRLWRSAPACVWIVEERGLLGEILILFLSNRTFFRRSPDMERI